MKQISKKKLIVDVVTVVVIAVITGAAAYINDYYHSQDIDGALTASKTVKVKEVKEGYLFDGDGQDKALIFYPGGKVEVSAYAPLLHKLAEQGMDCFLVEMPGNLAVLGKNKADKLMEAYDYDKWYMAGHSLGGAMAATYTSENQKQVSGLVLLGAYSTGDLSQADMPVIVIYGSEDKVMNQEKYKENKGNLPKDATILELQGGNHSYYGNYGEQEGDGKATISPEEQQAFVVENIIKAF